MPNRDLQHLFRMVLCLTLLGALAACGFQLRGAGNTSVPDEWKSMYLVTDSPNDEFTRAVVATFAANGVQWTDAESANFKLVLGAEQFKQSNLSLNAEARVSEFELTMSSQFRVLHANGEEAMPPTTAQVIKQMENDPRNVVGKESELRLTQSEMRTDLAQQIMRRIGFYAITHQSQTEPEEKSKPIPVPETEPNSQ